jgi:hypothetical protein
MPAADKSKKHDKNPSPLIARSDKAGDIEGKSRCLAVLFGDSLPRARVALR